MSGDLLKDLQKLSGAIDRHKNTGPIPSTSYRARNFHVRSNTYTNPSYRPSTTSNQYRQTPPTTYRQKPPSVVNRNVTIGGKEFKASQNKLTRKDAPTALPPSLVPTSWPMKRSYPSKKSHYTSRRGAYKSRGTRPMRNKTLNRTSRIRKVDKQCPFFTKTGTCARGEKCPYQHDPEKIAICSRFLHNDCPFTEETCPLSHVPTPNRAPLCIHFANSGRCKNGENCVYPHFNVGSRTGVCKDFAVLGYCEKGIICDKQHIKECPAFAENGICTIKRCKLPHVIRAKSSRKAPPLPTPAPETAKPTRHGISFSTMAPAEAIEEARSTGASSEELGSPQDNGDYIPLTFEESEDEEEDVSNSGSEGSEEDEPDPGE